ncbi:hypothetical protein BVRB_010640 [Beta vulgaris subsp. vulgaris]|uniref:Uncharacterized protein n=1 Tax=Beta vulgaris subsp. vulgaris TaxID=3555 RepID=A0A0J8B5S7_BETVV|nr:hypothetical protein BVRB_010640 [Beta vulgaris subsp. vulgaris]
MKGRHKSKQGKRKTEESFLVDARKHPERCIQLVYHYLCDSGNIGTGLCNNSYITKYSCKVKKAKVVRFSIYVLSLLNFSSGSFNGVHEKAICYSTQCQCVMCMTV